MKMYLNATVYFNKLLQISAIFRYFTKKNGFFRVCPCPYIRCIVKFDFESVLQKNVRIAVWDHGRQLNSEKVD